MEFKQAKRLFYNWLQKKGVYERYKHNRHITNNTSSAFGYRKHIPTPHNFIDHAFLWEDTPEGYYFWEMLNEEWWKTYHKYE